MHSMKLEALTTEDLQKLKEQIECLIASRQRGNEKEYTFTESITADPTRGKSPYIARLYYENDELKRDFYRLSYQKGYKKDTISGSFSARQGDIIEMRFEGFFNKRTQKWAENRVWYLVHDGDLIEVADFLDSRQKTKVIDYLKGKLNIGDMIKL
ncbi:hypothetical protein [Gorillibacterium sp. sgz5001074]|uniref:hypothetical protein n=1 Tax=Gorillibacterium sp. sgz5001074 TaxID=3446695 RepID=UPI003F672E60